MGYIYDFNFCVHWEAKIGTALKKSAVVKGEKESVFLGYPAYHGSFHFPGPGVISFILIPGRMMFFALSLFLLSTEVSHDLRKDGDDFEVRISYDHDKRPEDKKEAKMLEELLGTNTTGLKACLIRFVKAFEDEYHKVVSIAQAGGDTAPHTPPLAPVPLAPLPTPWQWGDFGDIGVMKEIGDGLEKIGKRLKGEGGDENAATGEDGEKKANFSMETKMEEL